MTENQAFLIICLWYLPSYPRGLIGATPPDCEENMMIPKRFSKSLTAMILAAALLPMASFNVQAGLISTQEALHLEAGPAASVDAWLARDEVAAELTALGVSPEMARLRAASLSPEELAELADRVEDLPAGAGVIEVLGITFLVLIILDLVGVINIFGIGR
jgi:hypothetical protein